MLRLLRRFGLRARIITAFAIGALLLSALLSTIAFVLTRGTILEQREDAATRQAFVNADLVRQLAAPGQDIGGALNSLKTPTGSQPIVYLADEDSWFSLDPQFDELALPRSLRDTVLAGQPATMRFVLDGDLQLAIGTPLPARHAAYFEVVSIAEIDRNLESLGLILFGASLITTMAGAAFGFYASRRVLQPLAALGEAAKEVAAGNLDIRLSGSNEPDPDLDAITQAFDDMVSTLANRLERDAQFASDVSHELRSPLMTLSASIEVLETRRDELPDERSRAALDLLVADIDRFRQLVEDLLEISRFDAGVVRLELDDVLLAELVMQSVAMTAPDVPVSIDANLAGTIVLADKRRLVRVITNLIDNARKYGGGATRVALEKTDDSVRIVVEDAGEGVAPEDRDQIFERFSRAGSAGRRGSTEGVGLGLALVAEHVKLHGGSVYVTDRVDDEPGARFVVDLPLELT